MHVSSKCDEGEGGGTSLPADEPDQLDMGERACPHATSVLRDGRAPPSSYPRRPFRWTFLTPSAGSF